MTPDRTPDWRAVPAFGEPDDTTAYVVRPGAYVVIPDGGRLALVRTPQGIYLPGGGIDPGETPVAAAVREAQEECGLLVHVGAWRERAVQFVWSPTMRLHLEKHCTFLDAAVEGRGLPPVELDHELLWVEVEEIDALLTLAVDRWAVGRWLEGRRR